VKNAGSAKFPGMCGNISVLNQEMIPEMKLEGNTGDTVILKNTIITGRDKL
jgi:tartrate dehydratase beta subunit/fumarate hydratase class I family protein